MVFNSLSFALFFAFALVVHRLPFPWVVRKINLVCLSYLFYAAWNPPFVLLLWGSTVVDWYIAKALAGARSQAVRRALLLVTIAFNLGLLGVFKYGTFLITNWVALLNALGISYQPTIPSIILPIGISFYTFETLSYSFDVYLRRTRPWHSPLDYALYLSFFPHLVAGPIVRPAYFLPQCETPRHATASQLARGLALMIVGLFEKVVLADRILAPIVEAVYDSPELAGFAGAWCGTLAFTGQIFCDFAGYSTCAIGAALCLGFDLPINFRCPYAAVGFSDFWRRWHITLSTWLRDYLYVPLGGNRLGPTRTQINLMLTMLLGGLWHGANWTFVAWGGLHGCYLVIERFAKRVVPAHPLWSATLSQLVLALGTFGLVCVAWVFFRAHTFHQAFGLLAAMFGAAGAGRPDLLRVNQMFKVLLVTGALLVAQHFMRERELAPSIQRLPWWARSVLLAAMLVMIAIAQGEDRAFIYFQF